MSPTKSQATCTKNQKQFTKFKNQAVYPDLKIQSRKLQSVVQNTSLKEHIPTVQRLSTGGSVTGGSSTRALDQVLLKNRFQPLEDYEECTSKNNQGSYTDQVTATKTQLKVNTKKNLTPDVTHLNHVHETDNTHASASRFIDQNLDLSLHVDSNVLDEEVTSNQGGGEKVLDDHVTFLQLHKKGNCNPDNSNEINSEPSNGACTLTGMCIEKQRCISQTGGYFGFVPHAPLNLYKGPSVKWTEIPSILQAHDLVKNSGTHNYLKCRIPVNSHLNINRWQHHLKDYWDQQIVDLLHYGFPLDFDRRCLLVSTYDNHTSAINDIEHVRHYVEEELQYEAIIGPFDTVPCPLHTSPLMTRAKQDSDRK